MERDPAFKNVSDRLGEGLFLLVYEILPEGS